MKPRSTFFSHKHTIFTVTVSYRQSFTSLSVPYFVWNGCGLSCPTHLFPIIIHLLSVEPHRKLLAIFRHVHSSFGPRWWIVMMVQRGTRWAGKTFLQLYVSPHKIQETAPLRFAKTPQRIRVTSHYYKWNFWLFPPCLPFAFLLFLLYPSLETVKLDAEMAI